MARRFRGFDSRGTRHRNDAFLQSLSNVQACSAAACRDPPSFRCRAHIRACAAWHSPVKRRALVGQQYRASWVSFRFRILRDARGKNNGSSQSKSSLPPWRNIGRALRMLHLSFGVENGKPWPAALLMYAIQEGMNIFLTCCSVPQTWAYSSGPQSLMKRVFHSPPVKAQWYITLPVL